MCGQCEHVCRALHASDDVVRVGQEAEWSLDGARGLTQASSARFAQLSVFSSATMACTSRIFWPAHGSCGAAPCHFEEAESPD